LTDRNSARSPCEQYARILSALEHQLAELDRAGANKAAAHLDAAIQQLRRDQMALDKASAGHAARPSVDQKTAILASFSTSFSQGLPGGQVFPRKAKPVNSS